MKRHLVIRGFTLTEVIIVMAILGVILSFVGFNVIEALKKGNDDKRLADLQALQLALRLYYEANGKYPPPGCGAGLMRNGDFPNGSTSPAGENNIALWQWASPGPFTAGGGPNGRTITVTCDDYIPGLVPKYIRELPRDPSDEDTIDAGFSYMTNFGQTEYKVLIYNSVESESPQRGHPFGRCPQICPRLGNQQNVVSPNWCFATPNYAVYSNTSYAPCW